jgi:hypothetical protein
MPYSYSHTPWQSGKGKSIGKGKHTSKTLPTITFCCELSSTPLAVWILVFSIPRSAKLADEESEPSASFWTCAL